MSLSEKVKKKLLAASGGYCGNPSCHRNLFDFFETGEITNIEEFAHIIGQKEEGPRGKDELPLNQRDEFDNIILLCPTCHTIVDKNPELYPKDTILRWKYEHEESIKNLFIAPKCKTREEARRNLQPILAENKYLFEQYGPYSENAVKDQFATELEWNRICLQKIIPNNRKIESLVSQNLELLTKDEIGLFMKFKIHHEGFENNHLSGDVNARIPMFPNEFENIYL
ncbi:MAG: HNH endonuclease [Bacteroidaceae bacterium]|nr:HNH endonuclease [Bacteroidaceae bacterium]